MAIRKPSGILVNGVGVYVKDPNATSGVFSTYQRVPGAGSITLPDEAAPQNDIVTLDGSVGAAGFSGVGTATIPLPVLGQHPTHRFLKRQSGGAIQLRIVKLAIGVDVLTGGGSVVTAKFGEIAVGAAFQQSVANLAREGMYVALGTVSTTEDEALDYNVAALDGSRFRAILNIADDGSIIAIAPSFTAVASAGDLTIIQPGLRWDNIQVQVAQMGDGDFQSASVVGGNLVLRPNAALPLSDIIVGTSVATDGTVS